MTRGDPGVCAPLLTYSPPPCPCQVSPEHWTLSPADPRSQDTGPGYTAHSGTSKHEGQVSEQVNINALSFVDRSSKPWLGSVWLVLDYIFHYDMSQHWPRGQQLVLVATAATLASSSAMHSGKLRPGAAASLVLALPPVSGAAHVAAHHVTWLQCAWLAC